MTNTLAQQAPPIDQMDKVDRKYFLDYQKAIIMEESRLNIIEKSIRIGITYGEGMRAVRRRMLGLGNLLHTSVNERIAKSFIGDCKRFCKLYDIAGASDVREMEVWNESENRRETAYEIEFKKQGATIKVFSSNPDAIRGEGGEVNIDEISSHKRPDDLLQAAGGRAMWGYPLNIWSSHKGVNGPLNRLLKSERAKGAKSRFKIQTITLYDALDQGLLEKINSVTGAKMSREDFILDTVALVGGEDAFQEECLCKPRASGAQAIKWQYLDASKTTYPLLRKHLEGNETFDLPGWFAKLAAELRGCTKSALGYDVARTGHLSAIPLMGLTDNKWRLLGLVTMHGRKFPLQRDMVAEMLRAVPNMVAAGDATGLGMQVCEELQDLFGEFRFAAVNFGASKRDIGTKMIKVFEDGRFQLTDAREDEDIQFDLAGIQTDAGTGGLLRFVETKNPINDLSHCDIAWAIGLGLFAGENESGGIGALAA